jgi:flavin reductase (DIM6/NTAB) family NADH-FMN oxidoreductase RutF
MTVTDVPQAGQVVNQMNEFDKEAVGKAIGRIASGVYIVTVEQSGIKDGIMASWIGQAAFEPPIITVAVHKDRNILNSLIIGKKFTVNVLSKQNQQAFKNFAKPFVEGMDRFEGLTLIPNSNAGPVIADSVAYMHCKTRTLVEAGDHVVVLGEVFEGQLLNCDEPMVHLRKSGFGY